MNPANRQLRAIMFTDIVGYTAMMGKNETKAMSVIKSNRSIHKRLINQYQGKWLKEMGDGTLASFDSITNAVYCAGQLQVACIEESIELRIGIHFGDVISDNHDIFGDGINVASRMEQYAEPGQIIASAPIHRNVKTRMVLKANSFEKLN